MDTDGSSWLWVKLPLLIAALAGLVCVAVAAMAEMVFASVNRAQLRRTLAANKGRVLAAEALLAEPARLLSTLWVTKTVGATLIIVAATLLAQRLGFGRWLGWWVAAAAGILILTQLLTRAWAVGRQEQLAVSLAPVVRVLAFLFTPVTAVLRQIGQGAVPSGTAIESIFLSEDGLRFLLSVGDEEQVIEEEEKEMIASIFAFSDKLVREVMVPRIDVAAASCELPMNEALDIMLKEGYSRLPVYRSSVDNIVGILYAKDFLRYLRDGRTDVPLTKILRPAYFIPESKKVDELLQELQQRRVHMAVVVDEYGGTAGVVTIEDLLEEIVGEIQDEYDTEEPTVEAVSALEYLFDARVALDEANKLLGVELPDEGGDTLGGFIYSQLGKVPAVGDRIEYNNATIEVLSVAGRRIKQVRATVTAPEPAPNSGGRSRGDAQETASGAALLGLLLLH